MVEPPWEMPRWRRLASTARDEPDRIDAVMAIEAPVLDGDEGIGQVRRHVLERDGAAAHLAARREEVAVDGVDLDGRRAFGDFQRLDRRQSERHKANRPATAIAAHSATTAPQ